MMAPNIPPVFELHFAVPGVRAVINTLNTRYAPHIAHLTHTSIDTSIYHVHGARSLLIHIHTSCSTTIAPLPVHPHHHRLDPPIVAFQLKHGDCRVLITDTEHSETVEAALQLLDQEGVKRCVPCMRSNGMGSRLMDR